MLIELTADVVAAYVSNNPVPVGELPNLIADIHAALGRVGGASEPAPVDKQKLPSTPSVQFMTTISSVWKTGRSSNR